MNFTVDWGASLLVGGVAFAVLLLGGLITSLIQKIVAPKKRPPAETETEKRESD